VTPIQVTAAAAAASIANMLMQCNQQGNCIVKREGQTSLQTGSCNMYATSACTYRMTMNIYFTDLIQFEIKK